MRAGLQDATFILDEDKLVGVNLGWDYCSEHEWGIKGIRRGFGMPEAPSKDCLGFSARSIHTCPNDLKLVEKGNKTYLVYNRWWSSGDDDVASRCESMIIRDHYDKKKELLCAWSEDSFGVRTVGKEGREHLRKLYDAFRKTNVVIFLGGGGGNPFANSGLTLCIYTMLPAEAVEAARESDKDQIRLDKAAEDTGVKARLLAIQSADKSSRWSKRCSFFALSPRWVREDIKKRTKYKIMFWLNPRQQDRNNSGWFTVEELDQWIEGEGPIPKK